MSIMKKRTVLDLFSGCGGLSLGFSNAGYHVILGIDHWDVALKTFEQNHSCAKIKCSDMSKLTPQEIKDEYKLGNVDVIIGGPPCQGFSISGKRNPDDARNKLYQSFVSFVDFFKPNAFVMENVPNLVSMNNGKIKDTILNEFKSLGYSVTYKILLAADFGVPQNRKRVFFVGLKNKENFEFPIGKYKNNYITSQEALSDLPEFELEDGDKYICNPQSKYQEKMRENSDAVYNHQITNHTEQTKKIISLVPDGGNYKNLPEKLQGTRKVNIAWTRLNSKKPSFTIDTGHNHHFHYKFNRVPTARESARLQSFPDTFIFSGRKNDQLKQVGNAVPPLLSEEIASHLLIYLESENNEKF